MWLIRVEGKSPSKRQIQNSRWKGWHGEEATRFVTSTRWQWRGGKKPEGVSWAAANQFARAWSTHQSDAKRTKRKWKEGNSWHHGYNGTIRAQSVTFLELCDAKKHLTLSRVSSADPNCWWWACLRLRATGRDYLAACQSKDGWEQHEDGVCILYGSLPLWKVLPASNWQTQSLKHITHNTTSKVCECTKII